jgi:hypothetical protein
MYMSEVSSYALCRVLLTSSIGVVTSGLCAKIMSTTACQPRPRSRLAPGPAPDPMRRDGLDRDELCILILTVVQLEPLQGSLASLDDVLPAETPRVLRLGAVGAEEHLGGDDDVTTVPSELLDHSAHLDLGLAAGVGLGVLGESACEGARQRHGWMALDPRRTC